MFSKIKLIILFVLYGLISIIIKSLISLFMIPIRYLKGEKQICKWYDKEPFVESSIFIFCTPVHIIMYPCLSLTFVLAAFNKELRDEYKKDLNDKSFINCLLALYEATFNKQKLRIKIDTNIPEATAEKKYFHLHSWDRWWSTNQKIVQSQSLKLAESDGV